MNKITPTDGSSRHLRMNSQNELNGPMENGSPHVTEKKKDIARAAQANIYAVDSKSAMAASNTYVGHTSIYITDEERKMWNAKQDTLVNASGNMDFAGNLTARGGIDIPSTFPHYLHQRHQQVAGFRSVCRFRGVQSSILLVVFQNLWGQCICATARSGHVLAVV